MFSPVPAPPGAVLAPLLLVLALLAGCAVEGPPESRGVYPVVDLHSDLGTIDGSTVLAGPAGWAPTPTLTTPMFPVPAAKLFDAMQELLLARPRTWRVSLHPDERQASFIVRSRAMNLPDIVIVQAVAASDTASQAVIFSRSRYDVLFYMGVNDDRVRTLVNALRERFGTVPGTDAKT